MYLSSTLYINFKIKFIINLIVFLQWTPKMGSNEWFLLVFMSLCRPSHPEFWLSLDLHWMGRSNCASFGSMSWESLTLRVIVLLGNEPTCKKFSCPAGEGMPGKVRWRTENFCEWRSRLECSCPRASRVLQSSPRCRLTANARQSPSKTKTRNTQPKPRNTQNQER